MTVKTSITMGSMGHFKMAYPGEWTYNMRRSMQEIIPGLYLGPYSAAVRSNLPVLEETGITHIICVRQNVEASLIRPQFPGLFQYLVLDIADSATENIIKFFPEANNFIEGCLSNGGKCLVHGNGGISRSAAIVIAYVMQKLRFSASQAYLLVQERRFCVAPNEGFLNQLSEFEPIYKAYQPSEDMSRISTKRKFQELESSDQVH